MDRRFSDPLSPAVRAFRLTLSDRDLRRLLAAWLAVNAGKWAFLVTTLVIAYDAGGAVGVGLLGLARFLTPVAIAPLAGLPTVRWRPEDVLRTANAIRTTAVALAVIVVLADVAIAWLYIVVALEAAAGAFSRPLHMGLLPSMSRSPAQLVAANIASSAAEGLGTFAGPAIASLLLILAGPAGATLAVLAIYAFGVAVIARLHVPAIRPTDVSARAVLHQVSAGLKAVATLPGPRIVVFDLALQTFVRGLLTVLVVVAAIELLGMGDSGVGALNAALGLGGLVGAFGAVVLASRTRLSPAFALALAMWGAPIALIGLVVNPAVALVAMLAVGVSNSFLDVAGFTLAQRTTPNASRVAVMGVIDSVTSAGVALGGIAAPFLIEAVGIQSALVITAAILPTAAALTWPVLRDLDEGGAAGSQRMERVRADPIFAPLSSRTYRSPGSPSRMSHARSSAGSVRSPSCVMSRVPPRPWQRGRSRRSSSTARPSSRRSREMMPCTASPCAGWRLGSRAIR